MASTAAPNQKMPFPLSQASKSKVLTVLGGCLADFAEEVGDATGAVGLADNFGGGFTVTAVCGVDTTGFAISLTGSYG